MGERFAGEVTLSSIQRGPFQSGLHRVLDRRDVAGLGLVPEAVVVTLRFAFEAISLHRVEISIIPCNLPAGVSSKSSQSGKKGSRNASWRSTGLGGPRSLRDHHRGVGRPVSRGLGAEWLAG